MKSEYKISPSYKNKFDWTKVMGYIIIYLAFLFGGVIIGMTYQQAITQSTMIKVASSLEGVTINIDLNETLLMDRATENMQEILWDIRMENCTRTEKNYCALECYENKKLIPCENFSFDEHFCSKGICEVDGIYPDYFEQLEGKTLTDCIKEVERDAKGVENE